MAVHICPYLPDAQIKSVGHARAQCHHTDQHAHFIVVMASHCELFLIVASIASVLSKPGEDICTVKLMSKYPIK